MPRRAANDRNLLSSRPLRPLDLSILPIPNQKLRSQISFCKGAVSNHDRVLALPTQNRASEQRAAHLPRGPGAAAPGALSPAFSRESGNPPTGSGPHGVGYSESLACMTGTTSRCWERRLFLTNVVCRRLSNQRSWLTAFYHRGSVVGGPHPPAGRRSVVGV